MRKILKIVFFPLISNHSWKSFLGNPFLKYEWLCIFVGAIFPKRYFLAQIVLQQVLGPSQSFLCMISP